MTTMTRREKCSTIVIRIGGKGTQGKITLAFANQTSKQDQVANTQAGERYCVIIKIKGARLA